jgi:eukaryotic-like serine/threonine-protein kinase
VVGKALGNYLIVDKLGEGGMGEVWRARDERLHRLVAIKILPPDLAGDPSRRIRFEQEARALGALNHPNIVTIYDVGVDDGRAYLVSELVEGESLRAVLDRGPLPVRKTIEIAVQMAEGMAAAHALGIVHRDLKPENVMLTRGGQVKLLDFGLAKQSTEVAGDKTATMALSQPGTVLGTAGYMSPEQVRAEPVDARSDIFSFGCVLYEMIAGKRAFQAGTGVETMHAILKAEPQEFEIEQSKMPPSLATIVRRCLEKQKEQRFQSAADLAFALRSITNTSASGVQPAFGTQPKSRKRWIWPVAAALAAIALAAAGFFLRDRTLHRGQPQFQRITFREGFVGQARFTADGKNIVYSAKWEGEPGRIYFAIPGSPDSRDLGMPEHSGLASISTRQEVAFFSAPFGDAGTSTLYTGSISGGQPRPVLEGVLQADWAPDGSSMAVLRRVNGITRLEYPIGHVLVDQIAWPLWLIRISPDGEHVAYAQRGNGTAVRLVIVDKNGKQNFLGPVSGQNSTGEDSTLVWSPKGGEVWFRSFDSGEPGIVYAVNMKGQKRVALSLPSRVKFYDISSSGEALLSTGSVQLGILGKGPRDTTERDLSCLDSGQVVGISSDGRLLLANITGESATPKGSIYMRKTDGSPATPVGVGHAYKLSPDGKWITGFVLDAAGARHFSLLPTGPGEVTETTVPGVRSPAVIGWLDGQQRYLVVGRKEKAFQCFAWDAGRGTVQPVCPEGTPDTVAYLVSPDGKQVLGPKANGGWVIYPVDGGAARDARGIERGEYPISWRSDNRSAFVRPNRESTASIPVTIVDLVTGKRTDWKEIRPAQPVVEIHDLYITPDGAAYAYNFVLLQSNLYVARGLQ